MRVLLFGPEAAAVGAPHVDLDLSLPCDCAQVRERLARAAPELAPALASARFAVNHAFADDSHTVHPGDEVALIGLVSGG